MVKLKYLKIEKYRNVKPGTELHFRDSLNVVLGRNGTGKTTLLNLIVQLLNWDFSKLQEDAASLEYGMRINMMDVSVRFRSEKARPSLNRTAGTQSLPGELLAMELLAQEDASTSTLFINAVRPDGVSWNVQTDGATLTVTEAEGRSHLASTKNPLIGQRTLQSILLSLLRPTPLNPGKYAFHDLWRISDETAPVSRRFDESLSYFDTLLDKDKISATSFAPIEVGRHFSVARTGPVSFEAGLKTTLDKTPEADELVIESTASEPSFLRHVVELLEFNSVRVRFQRIAKTYEPHMRVDFGKPHFAFTKRDGSVVDHSLLSYGQKRLLAFFYYLETHPAFVIADELVNGMHHEWIEACLNELGERQAFLTSQNPLLLDYLSFESDEEVRSSFVLCRTELHENREQLVWENMTAEDSKGFFKAYQAAIQHVSELLRTRGLW